MPITAPTMAGLDQRRSRVGYHHGRNHVFIERLWRSLKYEAVYLHEFTDGFAAERAERVIEARRGRRDGLGGPR